MGANDIFVNKLGPECNLGQHLSTAGAASVADATNGFIIYKYIHRVLNNLEFLKLNGAGIQQQITDSNFYFHGAAHTPEIMMRRATRREISFTSKANANAQAFEAEVRMLKRRATQTVRARLVPPSAARRRKLAVGALAAVLFTATVQASVAQMSLPGDFAVTSSGGANYKIPIVVPPGTAGMVPSLSLEYSSESGGNANGWLGAGLLGVGWSLGGLSAIARCPQTVAQDNQLVAVNYTSSDRFCLEGQRLIAINGAYGADGTEYRTEVDSFSRVISHGTAGTGQAVGPAWFEVHTKTGQVLQFGYTTDSQILAIGNPNHAVRSWAVNKVSDSANNYYTISYQLDPTNPANGQVYPLQINYTGNANPSVNLSPYNSVKFVYASRPDITPIYQAGSLMQTTQRLTDVQTYAGSTLVADYQLLYQQGSATGRSQLQKVTLCGAGGVCLPATTFTWQNGTTTPTVISNVAGADHTLVGSRPYLADFNGTGRTGILWDDGGNPTLPWSSGAATRVLWSFTGASTVTPTSNFAGIDGNFAGYVPVVGDFNRDGRADIWWYALNQVGFGPNGYENKAAGPTAVSFSNSDGTYTSGAGPTLPVDQSNAYRLLAEGDLNGDGRSDLLWIHQVTSNLQAPVIAWRLGPGGGVNVIQSNDAGGVASSNGLGSGSWLSALGAADFNGDGFTDLLWTTSGSFTFSGSGADGLWLSNGLGGFTSKPTLDGNGNNISASVTGYTPFFGDFNGDGKTDILWVTVDGFGRSSGLQPVLWTSRGDSNGNFVVNSTLGGLTGSSVANCIPTVADFNGDGIADVLWVPSDANGLSSSGQPVLWLGKGDGTFTVSNFGGTPLVGYVALIGDFNGDGKADVLWDKRSPNDSRSQGFRVIWLSDGIAPDLLTGVTNGLGATVAITYNSITNNNGVIYSKGTTATDPTVDVQAPMQVVSRVDKSNGIGGVYSTTYTYAGAQFDNNGRGFLGFRQFTATDPQTGIVQTTTFLQSFPFLMQVASDIKTLGSTILSSIVNTYGSPSHSAPYQVTLNSSVVSGNDLDGSALPQTTTSYTYDGYNNALGIAVSISDGSTKTTTNQFTNDTTHWYLGRLTSSVVTSTAP
jgi:Insecticide toxin TcdB middle/N-terminal region/FG-GAP-like repeat/Salmonella virulence plasmid 65kDa B protein